MQDNQTNNNNRSVELSDDEIVIGCMTEDAIFKDVPYPKGMKETSAAPPQGQKKRRVSRASDSIKITNALFLTYPQIDPANCNNGDGPDLNKVKDELTKQLNRYGSTDNGIIAREKHADGNWHVHVYYHLLAIPVGSSRTVLHADLTLWGKHGNYQAPRSNEAVIKYCKKEGDFIWWGINPHHAHTARKEHSRIFEEDLVSGKASLADYVEANPSKIRDYLNLKRSLMAYRADTQRARLDPPQVLWIQGPSGVGKTTLATACAKNYFIVPLAKTDATWWMDGYSGEEVVIFDNLSAHSHPPMDWFLKVLDRGNCASQVKGGMVSVTATKIIITSTGSPEAVFYQCDTQLMRRITQWLVLEYSNPEKTDITTTTKDLSAWKTLDLTPTMKELIAHMKATTQY